MIVLSGKNTEIKQSRTSREAHWTFLGGLQLSQDGRQVGI